MSVVILLISLCTGNAGNGAGNKMEINEDASAEGLVNEAQPAVQEEKNYSCNSLYLRIIKVLLVSNTSQRHNL